MTDTPPAYAQWIADMVREHAALECDVVPCAAEAINPLLQKADAAGVQFALVVWPNNADTGTCALNFLRMAFGQGPVGYEGEKVEKAVEMIRVERANILAQQRQLQQQQQQQQGDVVAQGGFYNPAAAAATGMPHPQQPTQQIMYNPAALPQQQPQQFMTAMTPASAPQSLSPSMPFPGQAGTVSPVPPTNVVLPTQIPPTPVAPPAAVPAAAVVPATPSEVMSETDRFVQEMLAKIKAAMAYPGTAPPEPLLH